MKEIFFHICCAPCFLYPFKVLTEKDYIIKGFFYNPNIHPLDEYNRRYDTLQSYVSDKNIEIIIDNYDIEDFFDKYKKDEDRCFNCYKLRLEKTAKMARDLGINTFSTSLLYSKRQKHNIIKEIGFNIAEAYKLNFYYEDFRVGWQWGIEESKRIGIYRQKYCGCLFSYKERFLNNNKVF